MIKTGLAIAAALAFAGCDNTDPKAVALETAEKKVKVGAYREAIRNYEDALDGTAKSADIHYKIAILYDEKLKKPLDAIHHYDRYLDFVPKGSRKDSHASECETARKGCEQTLQANMREGGFMTTSEAARLRNDNEALRAMNNTLAAKIASLEKLYPSLMETSKPKRVADPDKPDKIPPGSRTHTVEKGDTLAAIARKYYKSTAMSSHIKDANFNQLGGKDVIKPGMVLIIPEPPKRPR